LLISSLQQNWRKGQKRFFLDVRGLREDGGGGGQGREMAQTMYAHMNKKTKKKENGYPVPDPNKIMINVTKEPSDITSKSSKKKSWKILLRNSLRRY
jgi:hypothetical protein